MTGKFNVKIFLLIVLTVSGCCRLDTDKSVQFIPVDGDILFQDSDGSPLCQAIETVTYGYQGLSITHVGIAAKKENGELVVIEATSKGVQSTPFKEFLNRSLDQNGNPKVLVGRLKPEYQDLVEPAIETAFKLKGKPYDKVFAIDNDAYYCSELIYQIFLQANENTAVFELQPMTFKDRATGQIHPVWKDYFSKLGVPVPEGRPGINPGAISRSKALTIIKKYGNLSKRAEKQKRK